MQLVNVGPGSLRGAFQSEQEYPFPQNYPPFSLPRFQRPDTSLLRKLPAETHVLHVLAAPKMISRQRYYELPLQKIHVYTILLNRDFVARSLYMFWFRQRIFG